MKEIGGYIELESGNHSQYHEDAIALDCGRSCVAYLIELRAIKRLLLPDYLCDSISNLCDTMGVSYRFYDVAADFLPNEAPKLEDGEWFLLVDYYGQLNSSAVDQYVELTQNHLIVDETQGFFRKAWKDADTFWNCRKWFGVPDGAYLQTRDGKRLAREIEATRSAQWMSHILGRVEDLASQHLDESRANESRLLGYPVKGISRVSESLLSMIDYADVRERRRKNWSVLEQQLQQLNQVDLRMPEGPFSYPLYCRDASLLRPSLAAKGVYVPTLWPNVVNGTSAGSVARSYAADILPLPLDQRYDEDDMRHMAGIVMDALSNQA